MSPERILRKTHFSFGYLKDDFLSRRHLLSTSLFLSMRKPNFQIQNQQSSYREIKNKYLDKTQFSLDMHEELRYKLIYVIKRLIQI